MLVLALDTAGPDCAVALARGSGAEILALASERLVRGHAERLIPMIEETLAAAGLAYGDLDRIAVTTGPGSFTGVRVGLAAARALALALDIPAIGVGTLDALLAPHLRERRSGTVIAALDARRGELFAQASLPSGATLIAPTAAPAEAIAARLAGAPRPLVLAGAGAAVLQAALGEAAEIAGRAESPDIADVARLGLAATPGARPTALYLRGADAKPQAAKAVARRPGARIVEPAA